MAKQDGRRGKPDVREGYDLKELKQACLLMFRRGFDTVEIARMLKVQEATVYNALIR